MTPCITVLGRRPGLESGAARCPHFINTRACQMHRGRQNAQRQTRSETDKKNALEHMAAGRKDTQADISEAILRSLLCVCMCMCMCVS